MNQTVVLGRCVRRISRNDHDQREHALHRPARASVHGRARADDRAALAGPVGRARNVRGTEPGRSAGRPRPARRPAEAVRARHVPVPQRHRPARRPPAGLHRHRRLRPVQADDRLQRAVHDGLRRVRPARRAVRGADRPAPGDHHRRRTSTTYRRQLRRLGLATTPAAACRPPTRRTTAGRSGSSARSSTRGTTPRRSGRDRSPNWSTSSSRGGATRSPTTDVAGRA